MLDPTTGEHVLSGKQLPMEIPCKPLETLPLDARFQVDESGFVMQGSTLVDLAARAYISVLGDAAEVCIPPR